MRRYYKGSDIPFRLSIKDKGGVIIPLASFDSLEVIFRTSGEQYTKYYKGGGITENEDGTYRIYASENAFGLLPDGLLKYTVKYTLNGTHDEIRECETDIFIKTPKQFQPKANVQDKSITVIENNSVSKVIPDGGYEGLGEVTVNVEIPFPLEVKTVSITENESTTTITTGEGYSGMSEVNVNVKVPIKIKLPRGWKFGGVNIDKFPEGLDCSELDDFDNMFNSTTGDFSQCKFTAKPTILKATFCWTNMVLPTLDTSEVLDATQCFYGSRIKEVDWKFPKLTNGDRMFAYSTIERIDNPFSAIEDFSSCFYSCTRLSEITIDLSTAKSIRDAFHDCWSLTDENTHIVMPTSPSDCYYTFAGCNRLTDFSFCEGMEFSQTPQSIIHFFDGTGVRVLPHMDTSAVKDWGGLFCNCRSLEEFPDYLDTSSCDTLWDTFYGCSSLSRVAEIDCTNLKIWNTVFNGCTAVTDMGGFRNISISMDVSPCINLTVDSLMNIINKAADVTSSPKTMTLGATNLAKLSDEQKAIATNKGWTLA